MENARSPCQKRLKIENREGEDEVRLLVDHARLSRTGALNDGDLVGIRFLCSWDGVILSNRSW